MASISARKFNVRRMAKKYGIRIEATERAGCPKRGVMLRVSILTIALAFAAGTTVFAQQLPPQPPPVKGMSIGDANPQERAACHPDVSKFCQTQLEVNPQDVLGILGCLQANRSKISSACQQVLASHGQ